MNATESINQALRAVVEAELTMAAARILCVDSTISEGEFAGMAVAALRRARARGTLAEERTTDLSTEKYMPKVGDLVDCSGIVDSGLWACVGGKIEGIDQRSDETVYFVIGNFIGPNGEMDSAWCNRWQLSKSGLKKEEPVPGLSTVEGTWQWAKAVMRVEPYPKIRRRSWNSHVWRKWNPEIGKSITQEGERVFPPFEGNDWELYAEPAPAKPAELQWPERCECKLELLSTVRWDNRGPYRTCRNLVCGERIGPIKETP